MVYQITRNQGNVRPSQEKQICIMPSQLAKLPTHIAYTTSTTTGARIVRRKSFQYSSISVGDASSYALTLGNGSG